MRKFLIKNALTNLKAKPDAFVISGAYAISRPPGHPFGQQPVAFPPPSSSVQQQQQQQHHHQQQQQQPPPVRPKAKHEQSDFDWLCPSYEEDEPASTQTYQPTALVTNTIPHNHLANKHNQPPDITEFVHKLPAPPPAELLKDSVLDENDQHINDNHERVRFLPNSNISSVKPDGVPPESHNRRRRVSRRSLPLKCSNNRRDYSSRSVMNRPVCLLVSLCIILLLSSAALVGVIIYLLSTQQPSLCLTEDCIRTASTLLSSMNQEADPCTDFYQYACGQWIEENPIPDDASSVSNFDNLNKNLEAHLNSLLRADISDDDGTAETKVKKFYQMCLNLTQIESTWRDTFDRIVKDEFKGWPSLDPTWKEGAISLEILYATMTTYYQADHIFKINVQPDDKNSSVNALLLDSPTLNLFGREFYLVPDAEEERRAYRTLIEEVLVLLGSAEDVAKQDAIEIMEFETALANISIADSRRNDIATLYHSIKLKHIKNNYKNFNWTIFMDEAYAKVGLDDEDGLTGSERLSDDLDVIVYGIDFIDRFDQLVLTFPMRTKTNYLCWCWFFKHVLRDLPDPFASILFKFYKELNMMSTPTLPWHNCVKRINLLMPVATGRMYVKEHFNEAAKEKVEEMIELIMEQLRHTLSHEDWLSPEAKVVANEKIDAMAQKVGFPDLLNDVKKVDKMYEGYQTYDNEYFNTKFNFLRMQRHESLSRLGKPVNRDKWVSGAAVVNAFYSPNTNEIIFPAGILQPVFYDPNFPWAMNFGGIGVVIGHEIIHGFDDRGRLYDKLGNIRQWWDNRTIEAFKEKALCIEDQYSSYEFGQVGININGKKTKGENIADNGGLKHAYKAYQMWSQSHTDQKLLPGVDMTHEQLFFINYAQIWCGHMNDKEAVRKIRTSEHCPGSIRVKGPLSNSPEFSKAFNCPVDAPMNPAKKCSVW